MKTPPPLLIVASLRRKALAFVLPVLLGVSLLVATIAWRQGYFENFHEISFVVDSAIGISRGMPVKLKGVTVGQVEEFRLSGNAAGEVGIAVILSLNQRYVQHVPNTSKVTLAQEGLIGQSYIEILPGEGVRYVASGESLPFERRRGLKEIIDELGKEAAPMLTDARQLAHRLADPEGDLQKSLKSAANLVGQLPEIGRQAQTSLQSAATAFDAVRDSSAAIRVQIASDVPPLVDKAGGVLDALQDSSNNIRRLTEELRAPLLAIGEDGQQASSDARLLVEGVKQSWAARVLLGEPLHQAVLPDSAAGAGILRPLPGEGSEDNKDNKHFEGAEEAKP